MAMTASATTKNTLATVGAIKGTSQASVLLQTLFAPGAGFRRIREDPHWLLPLALSVAATFIYTLFALPAVFDRVSERLASLNGAEAAASTADLSTRVIAAGALLASFVMPLTMLLITTGLIQMLAVLLGGNIKTTGLVTFSCCSYASLALSADSLVRAPLVYLHRTVAISLGADRLYPALARSFLTAQALQFFDPFRIWYVILLILVVKIIYGLSLSRALLVSLTVNLVWFSYTAAMNGYFLQ